jgi:multiple sugar transport system permease protein
MTVLNPPAMTAASRRERPLSRRDRPLWMLIPGATLLLIIVLIPIALGFWMSLLKLNQYTLQQWLSAPLVGIRNYVTSLTDSPLLMSLWISVSFAVLATLVALPIGVTAAVATQNPFPGRALIRAIFLVPYVLPSFVVAMVWRTMFQPDGVMVKLLNAIGIHQKLWLNGPGSFWTLVFVEIWASWPFIYLMALSGLQSVPNEVHEAAALDGAPWHRKLFSVVLPFTRGPVALGFVIAVLNHINNFTLPLVLFGIPAPAEVQTLPFLTYIQSFQDFQFGLSAATSFLSLAFIAIPLLVYVRSVKLDVEPEGGR